MCKAENMGISPWGVMGGGRLKSEDQRQQESLAGRSAAPPTEKEIKISNALDAIARRKNSSITSVALAYVMHKTPYVFPIVGGRKLDHIKGNIQALTLQLTSQDIQEIEEAYPFELGFPHDFLFAGQQPQHLQDVWFSAMGGNFDYVPELKVSHTARLSES